MSNTAVNSEQGQTLEEAKEKLSQIINNLPGMEAVDTVIRSKLVSDAHLLEEIPRYLLNLGGKRMRPVLTLLVARAFGQAEPTEDLIDVAAGIELIHMATLLHDDIIDKSDMRRHQESPLLRFGQSETLLAGDFLLVRAFSLCARLDKEIIDATEEACVRLTEGEILEVPLYKKEHSRETSLEIADKKTAALFELAAYSAAHIATRNPEISNLMASFGKSLGIAFQILDDILDVTSDADLLGKPSGTDIRERKPSMINILWLESDDEQALRLREEPGDNEAAFVEKSVNTLRESTAVQEARSIALSYTDLARESLKEALAKSSNSDPFAAAAIESIIDYTVNRVL